MKILADLALLPGRWANNVVVDVDNSGRIAAVRKDDADAAGKIDHHVGVLLPAPVNVHSHAFQRAMAGLTESRGPDPRDSFWTWRRLMYRFLEQLTPQHVEAITAFVQMEMLEAGFATNVEFHYLHHQPDGRPYDNLAEMAQRVAAAASHSGIGLTMLPVHYQYGGCDRRPLGAGQRRFGNDLDRYARLLDASRDAIRSLPGDAALGVAPHSLRAVARMDIPALLKLAGKGPIHMHLAEQVAEVEEVLAAWGARPVEWLLDNAELSVNWCLVHCTQMQPHETSRLAATGAVAGLCPITESSLGDGIFDAVRWFENGGKIAIGSDSNIRISLSEEIRTLEYSQRLRDGSRAALATGEHSTGRRIFDAMLEGGAQAARRSCGRIEAGYWADLMALDSAAPDLVGRSGDIVLDSFCFAGDDRLVREVWSAGRHQVAEGRHIDRENITRAYRQTLSQLRLAI